MKINKVFNKKIIITLIATFTILISGVFGTSKIFAEEGETENKTYYKEENMYKSEDLGYIPIELEQKVFELSNLKLEVEGDDDGSIEGGGEAYISLTLELVDQKLLGLIANGEKLKYDFSFAGIHSEKIKLREINTFKFKMGFMVHGMGLELIFEESELDMFFDNLFGFYDLAEEVGSKGEQAIDFTYYIGLSIYEDNGVRIREIDMPLPIDQYAINYYSNNSILETSDEDFESGINFEKFLNGNDFIKGERLRVDNGFLEIDGYEDEDEDIEVKYNIDFVDGLGNTIESQEVIEGEMPIVPESVEHPENSEKYKFVGWDKEIVAANEDTIYTAVFEINKFEVIFFNHLGEQIDFQVVNYGESAVAPEVEIELFDRVFESWDNDFEYITENISVNAIYSMKHIFEIRFFHFDGSIIEFLEVYEGDEIIIPTDFEHPENPEKYEFSHWDRTVKLVAKQNESYYAEYTLRSFNVSFFDLSGDLISSEIIEYGGIAHAPELEEKELFDRVFIGWAEDVFVVTADREIHPQFEMKNLYTLIFKNYDGTIIETMTLYEGQRAVIEDPTYESEIESHEYVFINWSDQFNGYAERDAEYTARYRIIKRFNIVFKNIDGTLLSNDIYIEGERVIVPEDFSHPSGLEKYEFMGWGTEFSAIANKDIEYFAEYRIKTFKIEFEDLNGDVIDTQIIEYGGSAVFPEFSQETVDKIFTGWKGSLDNIIHDKRFIASFEMKELFFVTFKNIDGSIIEVLELYEGQAIEAPLASFVSDNELFEYIFVGWDKDLDEVAEKDVEYFAQYELIKRFRVVFRNADGSIISEGIYLEGDSITSPSDVIHPGNSYKYNFIGWSKEIVDVNEDADYIAIFEINTFTVKFLDLKGKVIDTQVIEYGESAVYPDFNQETIDKIFTGWEGDITNITSNQTFKATFEIKDLFFITFKNIDGSIIEVLELYEGEPIKAPLTTFISDNELKEYIFKGWNEEVDEFAERDIEYIAEYDIVNKYRITFKNIDGSIILENIYLEGDLVNEPKNVEHPENEDKFKFTGWNKDIETATEDTEYIAVFEINTFTVDFYDNDNRLIERQTVLYGEDANHPEKELDKIDRYFIEWDSSLENITANIIVNAVYEVKELYTYTFLDYDKTIFAELKFYEGQQLIVPAPAYKSGQNSFDFIFSHWSPELQEFASEDAIYEAVYDVIEQYRIVFKDLSGKIVSDQLVLKGELPEAPTLDHPTENHKFIQDGWNEKVIPADSDQVYEVRYKLRTFTVDFFFDHKTQRISRQTVEFGNDAVAPNTDQERYTFVEWDVDFTNVTENIRVTGIFKEDDHVMINFLDTDGNLIHSIKNYGDTNLVDLQRNYSVIFDQPLHKFGHDISNIYEVLITEDSEEKIYYNFGKELEINQYRDYNFVIEYEERELHEVTIVLFDGTEVVEYVYDGYFPKRDIPSVPDYKFYGFVHNGEFLKEEGITIGHIGLRIYKDETIRLFYTDNSGFYKEIELGKDYDIHAIPNHRTWLFKDLEIEAGNYHFIFKTDYRNETKIVNVVISEESISMMVSSIPITRQKLLLGSGYFVINSQTTIGDKVTIKDINGDPVYSTFFSTRSGQFSLNKGHVDFSPETPDETPDDGDNTYVPPRNEWKLTIQNILILLFGITGLVVVYRAIRWVFPGKKKRGRRR